MFDLTAYENEDVSELSSEGGDSSAATAAGAVSGVLVVAALVGVAIRHRRSTASASKHDEEDVAADNVQPPAYDMGQGGHDGPKDLSRAESDPMEESDKFESKPLPGSAGRHAAFASVRRENAAFRDSTFIDVDANGQAEAVQRRARPASSLPAGIRDSVSIETCGPDMHA